MSNFIGANPSVKSDFLKKSFQSKMIEKRTQSKKKSEKKRWSVKKRRFGTLTEILNQVKVYLQQKARVRFLISRWYFWSTPDSTYAFLDVLYL